MLDHLDSRFGRYAIPGLIRYVVLFNALVYVLQLLAPGYLNLLQLDVAAVYSGEVWRLFTWIFVPRTTSTLWILFALLFLWFLGDLLEASWTAFRVNLFYLSGWFFCTVAALVLPGSNLEPGANFFLNLTVLLAAATLQPNYQILFFFVIPLKLKWLAWISLLAPVLLFLGSSPAGQGAIAMSLANYALFFGPAYFRERKTQHVVAARRARFEPAATADETLHRCVVCGRTEESAPDLEFRVARDGREYCSEHLSSADGEASRG